MSTWYYYDEEGDKIAVTGGQLKGLAKAGRITPETIIETEDGKSAPARKVKGLTFAMSEVEAYGLSQPAVSSEPSPFTASMPVATKPVAENPFNAAMPTAIRAVQQSVSVPVVEEDEYHNSRSPIRIFVGVSILLFVLVLIGIGISKLGGGGSGKPDQRAVDALNKELDERVRQKKDKLNEGYNEVIRDINRINRGIRETREGR